MLKEILSGDTCAKCRMCCIFDRYDIWETPVFDENSRKMVMEYDPEAKFAQKGSGFVLNVGEITDGELYKCPALTENGCVLGDNGVADKGYVYHVLREKTNLKECYGLRYADDFRIFCRKRQDAERLFIATQKWLKERLGLDISPRNLKSST